MLAGVGEMLAVEVRKNPPPGGVRAPSFTLSAILTGIIQVVAKGRETGRVVPLSVRIKLPCLLEDLFTDGGCKTWCKMRVVEKQV